MIKCFKNELIANSNRGPIPYKALSGQFYSLTIYKINQIFKNSVKPPSQTILCNHFLVE